MELFRLFGKIAVDNTEAKKAIDDTTKKAKDGSKEQSSAFEKIGKVASKVGKGVLGAGVAMGGAFIASVEGTREYRKEMGLLESAFVTAGHTSEEAKNTYSELNAVLGDSGQAVEASQHLAKIADNEKDLSTWTDICTGVYSEFGEAIPLESLTESALEVQKNGQLTGGLVDALVWAGISEEEFQEKLDACTSEQERQDLIMNTLNDTYKDASKQYKETNKDVLEAEKAQQRLTDAMAEVGAVGEPIMTKIKNAIADMAEKAAPMLQTLIDKTKDMITWFKENQSTVQTWIGVILGASAAVGTFLLIMNWSSIMASASKAIKGVRLAVLAFNTALMANPIGIVVGLLVGLVATFIYLWNNVDGFKEFWIKTWEIIKKSASSAYEWIKKTFSNIGKWFSEKFSQISKAGKDAMDKTKKWFSDAYKSVTNTFKSIGSWFGGIFKTAWKNIKNAFSNWGSFFSGLWTSIKSKFSTIGTTLGSTMSNAVKTGMNSIIGKIESTINKGIGLINSAIKLANKLGFNVGTVGELDLPRLAEGTVVKRPTTAIIGEAGPEAVVPLKNNREWLTQVAKDLNELQGGQQMNLDEVLRRLDTIIRLLEKMIERKIYLDSNVLVGELAPAMNMKLGKIYSREIRR